MCLAQGHVNEVTPARLEPAAPRSRVMHSTTEPVRSLFMDYISSSNCSLRYMYVITIISYRIVKTRPSVCKITFAKEKNSF